MERFVDIVFGNIQYNIAVSCPEDILAEFNNGSKTRFPTIPKNPLPPLSKQLTFYVAVESEIVRLFTAHYLRYLFLHSILVFVVTVYGKIWYSILENGTETWCTEIYPNYTIRFVKDPSRMEAYPRLYSCLYSMSLLTATLIYPIMATHLVLHRLCTYMALAYPFAFNQYFNPKNMKIYYYIIEIVFLVYHFLFRIVINLNEKLEKIKIPMDESISAFLAVLNIFLTILSIHAIFKYRKQGKAELKNLNHFLGFSIFPLTVLIAEKMFKIAELLQAIILRTQYSMIARALVSILDRLLPIYTCILFFAFIPVYRRAIIKLIKRQNHSQNVTTILPAIPS